MLSALRKSKIQIKLLYCGPFQNSKFKTSVEVFNTKFFWPHFLNSNKLKDKFN